MICALKEKNIGQALPAHPIFDDSHLPWTLLLILDDTFIACFNSFDLLIVILFIILNISIVQI